MENLELHELIEQQIKTKDQIQDLKTILRHLNRALLYKDLFKDSFIGLYGTFNQMESIKRNLEIEVYNKKLNLESLISLHDRKQGENEN